MAVASGRYRHRIKILKSTQERSGFGGYTNSKEIVAEPWCKIVPLSDNENSGTYTTGQMMYDIEIRYSKTLENPTSDMYVEFKGKEYDIITVLNHLELNEKLKVVVKERTK